MQRLHNLIDHLNGVVFETIKKKMIKRINQHLQKPVNIQHQCTILKTCPLYVSIYISYIFPCVKVSSCELWKILHVNNYLEQWKRGIVLVEWSQSRRPRCFHQRTRGPHLERTATKNIQYLMSIQIKRRNFQKNWLLELCRIRNHSIDVAAKTSIYMTYLHNY